MTGKIYLFLLWAQGLYTLLTALWGLLDIESFMIVTGPKTDVWLVKTVSVVLAAVALSLLAHLNAYNPLPAIILGFGCSAGLAAIDFYYSLRGTISVVYLWDGVLEVVFAFLWLYVFVRRRMLKAGLQKA